MSTEPVPLRVSGSTRWPVSFQRLSSCLLTEVFVCSNGLHVFPCKQKRPKRVFHNGIPSGLLTSPQSETGRFFGYRLLRLLYLGILPVIPAKKSLGFLSLLFRMSRYDSPEGTSVVATTVSSFVMSNLQGPIRFIIASFHPGYRFISIAFGPPSPGRHAGGAQRQM